MGICDWPEDERPREKLLTRGVASLSDAELLALFLRTGTKGLSAVDLAKRALAQFGSLSALIHAPLQAFAEIPGLGPAKYAQLAATVELTRRALAEELHTGDVLSNPDSVRNYLRLLLARREIEVFVVLFLSNQNRVLAVEEVAHGTINQTAVYPREIARHALKHHATAVIVAHNHPSGAREPSEADRALTKRLVSALQLLDIRLLDHFIVAGTATVSFAEEGWL